MSDEDLNKLASLSFSVKTEAFKAMLVRMDKALKEMNGELFNYRQNPNHDPKKANKSAKRLWIIEDTIAEAIDYIKVTEFVLSQKDANIFKLRNEAKLWHNEYVKSCNSEIELTKTMFAKLKISFANYSMNEVSKTIIANLKKLPTGKNA